MFVFKHSVKLGGYHAVRKTLSSNRALDSGGIVYEMTESERKELLAGSAVNVAAPEVLLGDVQYSWRCDVWSAGCVALAILFDNWGVLVGADVKVQLDKIFRSCGTPSVEWKSGMKLPLYKAFKPRTEYNRRLSKTLAETNREKGLGLPADALAVLDAMLQLDPQKRSSVRELLAMDWFADVATAPSIDFSALPETFAAQKNKLLAHLKSAKAKRRRPSSGEHSAASSSTGGSAASSSHRSSSAQSHARKEESRSESRGRKSRSSAASGSSSSRSSADAAEDVPLPAFFSQATDERSSTSTSSSAIVSPRRLLPPRPEKRAKLGWGMGLHSDKSS